MESVERVSLSMEKLSMDQTYLSEKILFKEILPKLPVKSLMRFKCVSKGWSARISSDQSFIADHSNAQKPSDLIRALHKDENEFSKFLRLFLIGDGESSPVKIDMSYIEKALNGPEDQFTLYMVGSSNGLVLIQKEYRCGLSSPVVLWNPATKEFRNIPEPTGVPAGMLFDSAVVHYGFGFGEDVGDYKIVRIGEYSAGKVLEEGMNILDVQIYTKRSGRWRRVEAKRGDFEVRFNSEHGVVIDGVIHWTLRIRRYEEDGHNALFPYIERSSRGRDYRLLTLSLRTEELKESDGPLPRSDDRSWNDLKLFNWKGSLGGLMIKRYGNTQFWLKTEGSHRRRGSRWTKMVTFKPPAFPLNCTGVLRDQLVYSEDENGVTVRSHRHEKEKICQGLWTRRCSVCSSALRAEFGFAELKLFTNLENMSG